MTLYTWSQTAFDNMTADTTMTWREGQAPSTVNNSARALMAAMAKARDDWSGALVTGGTSTAYTITTNQSFASLADGRHVVARLHVDSGATPTLNVDATGAKSIYVASATAPATAALQEGGVYSFTYVAAETAWMVHGYTPQFTLDDGVVTNAKLADMAASTLKGRSTGSTGDPEDLTLSGALSIVSGAVRVAESLIVAVSDESTAITTGTAKTTFRMPYAFTLTAVRASLTTVSSSGTPTVDINENGSTILSTKLTIDANEKTSTTAATAAVISDTGLADDAEITIDIDTAGTGAKGLKVYLIGYRP